MVDRRFKGKGKGKEKNEKMKEKTIMIGQLKEGRKDGEREIERERKLRNMRLTCSNIRN